MKNSKTILDILGDRLARLRDDGDSATVCYTEVVGDRGEIGLYLGAVFAEGGRSIQATEWVDKLAMRAYIVERIEWAAECVAENGPSERTNPTRDELVAAAQAEAAARAHSHSAHIDAYFDSATAF